MQADQAQIDAKFRKLARERIERWIALADERLEGTNVKWYVTGGNDDQPEVLTVFDEVRSEHVVNCEAGSSWSTISTPLQLRLFQPDPVGHPREVDEDSLEEILEEAVHGIDDFTSAIFNFHVPPYDCTLDDCPKLDWSTDPPSPIVIAGVAQSAPAGSTAVRKVIEKYKPLLALTGHIHESRGWSPSPHDGHQPGSEYGEASSAAASSRCSPARWSAIK